MADKPEKPKNPLLDKRNNTKNKMQSDAQQKKTMWNVGENYKITEVIGKGAYSIVAAGIHVPTGKKVAIKRIVDLLNKKHEALRILREVVLLRMLDHPNIIKLYEIVVPDMTHFNEIYLIEEYYPRDIKKLLRTNLFLTMQNITHITYRILVAIKYLNSAKVLHRDLKPENILINEYLEVKLCDFGLARPVGFEQEKIESKLEVEEVGGVPTKDHMEVEPEVKKKIQMSGHVTTRWYRAPELILLERNYNSAIDVWSVGCIFAELLNMMKENASYYTERSPLFPGKACYPLSPPRGEEKVPYKNINDFPHSSQDQLDKIFQIIGTPDEKDYSFITDHKAIKYIKSFSHKERKNFKSVYKSLTPEAEDFITRSLLFNPNNRISIDDTVDHPLFDSVRNKTIEIQTKPFTIDLYKLSIEQIKKLFMKELQLYQQHKPVFT